MHTPPRPIGYLTDAYDQLQDAIAELGRDRQLVDHRGRIDHAMRDLARWVDSELPILDAFASSLAGPRVGHDAYELATEEQRDAAHIVFKRTLTVADALVEAVVERWGNEDRVQWALDATHDLLDALTPFVSRADDGIRMVSLEGVALADVLRRLGTTAGPLSDRRTRGEGATDIPRR